MKGSTSEFFDWADLPSLVLHLISEKINFITDYVRYRAVCSSWRFASLPKPRHLPPQLPWLFLPQAPYLDINSTKDEGIRLFYDFWQFKMHKHHLPETIDKIHIPEIIEKEHKILIPETIENMCLSSYRGWLLFVAHGDKEIFLLNPLTRARIQLPSFITTVNIIGPHQDTSIFSSMFNSCINFQSTKLSFSTDPTNPKCLIMVFVCNCRQICFCKVEDHCWTDVDLSPVVSDYLEDVVYSNERFYLLHDRLISIYDPKQHKVLGTYFFKPEFRPNNKFFLEGTSGLYVVAIHYSDERGEVLGKFDLRKAFKQTIELYQIPKQWIADDRDSLDRGCTYLKCMENVQFVCVACVGNDGDAISRCSILSVKLDEGNSELVAEGTGEKLPYWRPFWMLSLPILWFQPSFV
ncbi:putative F-box protein At4g17565 [Carex rostrata]